MKRAIIGLVAAGTVVLTVDAAAPASASTVAERQAIGAAHDYLRMSGFSKQGLIDQLDSKYADGYSKAVATYAVNHISVNWAYQAVRVARAYLKMTHFSRRALIAQLSSPYGDEFTRRQAIHAANRVGL